MTNRLSLSSQAQEWFDDEGEGSLRLPVSEWLAAICDDPASKRSHPIPSLPEDVRWSWAVIGRVAVVFSVLEDIEVVRVHRIRGHWAVPMM